jgi:hypothetical protein
VRTPAGKECRYFYADYNRGRNVQECRLIKENPQSLPWRPNDCAKCPIPEILNANASPHLELKLTKTPVLLGLGRRLIVDAWCQKHHMKVEDAFIGCPRCNAERPGLDVFWQALDQNDDE